MTRVKDRFILILITNHLRQSKPLLVFAVSVSVSLLVLVSDHVMDQWPRPTVVVMKSEETGPGAGTSSTTRSSSTFPVQTTFAVQTAKYIVITIREKSPEIWVHSDNV
ncbi:uncharacterized protein LOC131944457 [Physella acuta]|uniref:uncharacterized protein LOC131944457 n=1 Tax=Physella acuta TaxID=109671 RepID=UPI0027DABB30|nr:uncharacterized protein LOC131944457 [Physella acuta]